MGLKEESRWKRGRDSTSWNQTKMGLKVLFLSSSSIILLFCWNQTKMGLKAGESCLPCLAHISWNQTKMGLKGGLPLTRQHNSGYGWNQTKMGLKEQPHIDYRKGGLCWNQTKMGLKVSLTFTFSSDSCVEIRPRWDWKVLTKVLSSCNAFSWNQTKMGLKERHQGDCVGNRGWVEIRPRWDWKQGKAEVADNSEQSPKLKSDQDGIESIRT